MPKTKMHTLGSLPKDIEKELVERIIENDSSAFEELYKAYVQRVYFFAKRYLTSDSDAEEVVQEVFTKLWENRKKINPQLSLSGYILTTTKNTIFNAHKKRVHYETYYNYVLKYFKEHKLQDENEAIFNDLKEIVHKAIEKLPVKRREIFKMVRFKGMTYKEVSKSSGVNEKTIETHMRLALKDLRKVLEPILGKIFILVFTLLSANHEVFLS